MGEGVWLDTHAPCPRHSAGSTAERRAPAAVLGARCAPVPLYRAPVVLHRNAAPAALFPNQRFQKNQRFQIFFFPKQRFLAPAKLPAPPVSLGVSSCAKPVPQEAAARPELAPCFAQMKALSSTPRAHGSEQLFAAPVALLWCLQELAEAIVVSLGQAWCQQVTSCPFFSPKALGCNFQAPPCPFLELFGAFPALGFP